MAANAGAGSGRRAMPMGASLDQQQQQQQQQQQRQQQQIQPQQQTQSRRSSAANFDQVANQLMGQYSQQQQQQIRRGSASSLAGYQQPQQVATSGDQAAGYYYNQQQQTNVIAAGQMQARQKSRPVAIMRYGGSQQQQQLELRAHSSMANQQQQQQQQMAATMGHIKDDIDIVFNRLMALEEFRKLPSSVIRNLCSCAFIERIDKGVIVFRQGDDAINWYVLLEGSVDVKVSQNGQKDGVTLCTLGVGQTFGASAAPGKSHAVSVVTSDECILLRVRRADFQEFFSEQSHLIHNVETSPFCSFTSLSRSAASSSSSSGQTAPTVGVHQNHQQHFAATSRAQLEPAASLQQPSGSSQPARANGIEPQEPAPEPEPREEEEAGEEEGEDLGELNVESIESGELSSYLMRVGWVLRALMVGQCPEMIQNRRINPQLRERPQQLQQSHAGRGSTASHKQLVSTASSSQLFTLSAGPTGKSAASLAGRKVANYVANSFMRANSKQVNSKVGAPLFTSNSFDAQQQQQQQQQQAQVKLDRHQAGELVLFKRCMIGRQMVDWLLELSGQANGANAARFVSSRLQAVSMWQVLLEQGVVFAYAAGSDSASKQSDGSPPANVQKPPAESTSQFQFADDQHAHYKFCFDRADSAPADWQPSSDDLGVANESLWWSLKVLSKLAPDASFRLILSKRPSERSVEEVDMVFEELQHLKALSHLTNSVKKELAACVRSEHHAKQNTVIFNQGDVGQSWYIILRGSVNVVIVGKGVVCTLHEGDDFGKLALVNEAARAATIITSEPNCYFLCVDKHNFNTILRDVEANTVRLREHGEEVLILQKVAVKETPAASQQSGDLSQLAPLASAGGGEQQVAVGLEPVAAPPGSSAGGQQQVSAMAQPQQAQHQQQALALKYMVMAGTSEKMLEHLLETRIDGRTQIGPLLTGKSELIQHDQVSGFIQCHGDNFLEDFILTHKIFMPTTSLCNELLKQYQCQTKSQLSSPANNSTNSNANSNSNKRNQNAIQSTEMEPLNGAAASEHGGTLDDEFLVAKKRRVVKFIRCWLLITREHFFQQQQIQSFLTTIHQKVKHDAARFSSLQPELKAVARILELHLEDELENRHKGVQRWIDDVYGNLLPIRRHTGAWEMAQASSASQQDQILGQLHLRRFEHRLSTIQSDDEVVFRVYCADHSFATIKARVDAKAAEIKQMAARKLALEDKELILVHVKSNGERIIFNDLEFNISTSLSVNGRLFVCPLDHIDAVSPLPEQDPFQEVYQSLQVQPGDALQQQPDQQIELGQQQQQQLAAQVAGGNQINNQANSNSNSAGQANNASGEQNPLINSHLLTLTPSNYQDIKTHMSLSVSKLEEFSSRDIAYCLTQLAWSLLKNMHEFELIYTVFGRHNFKQITANLNVFLRHFNEIQYWVVTQICLSTSLSKRVQILRKFIKIAAHCKEMQNLNAFFAITMGLSNMAVARLTQTWERLPSKLKRTFSQFESLIDPSRNQRRYRIFISKMEPPIIPFMPLFLKDMTFAHEGNKTYLENGLINFEKMQMVAQSLRTIRYCKSRPMKLDSSACKFKGSIRSIELFFRDLKIIDNQRTLTQMSLQLEHRKK